MGVFAFGDADLDFDVLILEVNFQGYQGVAFDLGAGCQLSDLFFAQEEFSGSGFLVIGIGAVAVLGDIDVSEKGLAVLVDIHPAVCEVDLAETGGFNLSSGQNESGLVSIGDGVLVESFTVIGNDLEAHGIHR